MKTRRFCPKCGRMLLKSRIKGYVFQCMNCDEAVSYTHLRAHET